MNNLTIYIPTVGDLPSGFLTWDDQHGRMITTPRLEDAATFDATEARRVRAIIGGGIGGIVTTAGDLLTLGEVADLAESERSVGKEV